MPPTSLLANQIVELDHVKFSLRVPDLAMLSKRAVTVDEPIPFGESPAEDLRWLRLIREVASYAVRLQWTLGGTPCFPLTSFAHLVPPARGATEESNRLSTTWSSSYRYGQFYFREGPGFVLVKDVRPSHEMRRLTIGEGSEHFLAMTEATHTAELSAEALEVVSDAVEADLAIKVDDYILVLPYRMRNWPVPYVAI